MKLGQMAGTIAARWRGLSLWARFGMAAIVLIVVIGGVYLLKGSGAATTVDAPHLRSVQVASVTDLQNDTTPLPLIGEVQSVNEAQIRSQSSGPITHLYHKLGGYVAAGEAIAEIDSASERASLLAAQGSLEAAQASVQKSGKLFVDAKTGALNTIKSVYSSNDDLVRSKLDALFANPTGVSPTYIFANSDQSRQYKVESTRVTLGNMLKAENSRGLTLTENSDLKAELASAINDTRAVKAYIDDVSMLLNTSVQTQPHPQSEIDGYISVSSGARTSVSASLASLTAASQALTSAQTDSEAPNEVSSADATVKQAQGAFDSAKANLEKTIIRSPISGTINNLTINLGDFVSAFQQVAVVSNNGSLEIVANVSAQDRASIGLGAAVRIENKYDGQIVSMAPAIDPTTKKIEVKISFAGLAAELTNGESVHLDIARSAKKTSVQKQLAIPVSAVKIGSDSSVVFTVGEGNKLVAHTVKTDGLVGDKIQIISGVTADMEIVTDARGLKDGQEVELQ